MPSTSTLYRVSARLASALVPVAGLVNAKVARSHAGRRGALDRLVAWAGTRATPHGHSSGSTPPPWAKDCRRRAC